MKISVLTICEKLYEAQAKEAILPGEEGEVCVLDFHQPFLLRLKKGEILLRPYASPLAKKKETLKSTYTIAIVDGIAKMAKNELSIIVEKQDA